MSQQAFASIEPPQEVKWGTPGLMSSLTPEWSTPQNLFDKLDAEFGFTLDVAATPTNTKCERFYTNDDDGLSQDWTGETVWCNPPYGREIGRWVAKAYGSRATCVLLLPARTDTAWWHDYCMKGEIRLVRGRLKFGDSKQGAPFPSAIVVFRGGNGA